MRIYKGGFNTSPDKEMNAKIIIDGTLVYHPQTHILHALDDEHNSIAVAVPASLCLMLLLEKHGKIVSQSELLAAAWHNRGMNVSANTLYQNIFLLRKALEKIGGNSTIIRTVPKRGFTISNETSVVHENEQDEPQTTPPEISPDLLQEPAETAIFTEPEPHVVADKARFKPLQLSATLGLFFIICAIAAFSLSTRTLPLYEFDDYLKTTRLDDCNIYRNESLRPDAFFTQFIRRNQLQCEEAKWWYITNHPPSGRISLIRCRYPIDHAERSEKRFCQSDYYLGLKYRD